MNVSFLKFKRVGMSNVTPCEPGGTGQSPPGSEPRRWRAAKQTLLNGEGMCVTPREHAVLRALPLRFSHVARPGMLLLSSLLAALT